MRITSFKKEWIPIAESILKRYRLDIGLDIYPYTVGSLSSNSVIVQGFVKKNEFTKSDYMIFVTKELSIDIKELIEHECAHIQQYEEGLMTVSQDVIYWKGKPLDYSIPYENRPWEIDAFNRVRRINRKPFKLFKLFCRSVSK